jgi:hypothetical protein
MRYSVQYIPLSKIKTGIPVTFTQRIKSLRKIAQDCMHLLIVRKSRKEGGYVLVSGGHHLEYLVRHTKKGVAPCLVDESKASSSLSALLYRLRKLASPERTARKNGRSIVRSFMKQEPRFRQLSRSEQLKVLRLGLQYKKTTVAAMKARVNELLAKKSS